MRLFVSLCGGAICLLSLANASWGREPTDFEQLHLELLNRARADPEAEVLRLAGLPWGDDGTATPDLNEGLPPGTITSDPKQPLAFNLNIIDAASDYSDALIAAGQFTHTLNGTTAKTRMESAGYVFVPTFTTDENLAVTGSSGSHPINATRAEQHHNNFFIDDDVAGRGHRKTAMSQSYREIGIGIRGGTSTIFPCCSNVALTAQDYAASAAFPGPFLTGVAFEDSDSSNFYSVSEGKDNVLVEVFAPGTENVVASTTTYSSGGYGLQVSGSSTYDVRFTDTGGLQQLFSGVALGSVNLKLDATNFVPVVVPTFWIGGDGNQFWTNASNWGNGVPGSGDVATFDSRATNYTVDLDDDPIVDSLSFSGSNGFTINNNRTFTLESGSVSANSPSATDTINSNVQLLADGNWSINMGATLNVYGTVSEGGSVRELTKTGAGTLLLAVANSYSGGTKLNGGTIALGNSTAAGSGLIAAQGSTIDYAAENINVANNIDLRHHVTLNTNMLWVTQSGVISESGGSYGVTKTGTGTLELTDSGNIYSGGTTIAGGTLLANNNAGSATGSGGVTVLSSGTLGGTGSAGGATTVNTGGTVAPGASAGQLSVDDITFNDGSIFAVEIGGPSPADHDALRVANTATINTGATLDIELINAFAPSLGQTFDVLAAASAVGIFDNVLGADIGGALKFNVTYDGLGVTLAVIAALLPGDANNDGQVTGLDLITVQQNFGNVGPPNDGTLLGDANDDGQVTGLDLIWVEQNFASTLDPAADAVPEPVTAFLFGVGCLTLLGRR